MRIFIFFFSSRRRHTRSKRDWSSDVCSSDLFRGYLWRYFNHDNGRKQTGWPSAAPRQAQGLEPAARHEPCRMVETAVWLDLLSWLSGALEDLRTRFGRGVLALPVS